MTTEAPFLVLLRDPDFTRPPPVVRTQTWWATSPDIAAAAIESLRPSLRQKPGNERIEPTPCGCGGLGFSSGSEVLVVGI